MIKVTAHHPRRAKFKSRGRSEKFSPVKGQLPKLTNYTPVPWHKPFSPLSRLFKSELPCLLSMNMTVINNSVYFSIERNSGYCSTLTWRALLDSFENQNRLKFKQEVPACSLKQIDTLQMGKSTPPFQLPRENRSFEGSTTARVWHLENRGKIQWKLENTILKGSAGKAEINVGWREIATRACHLMRQIYQSAFILPLCPCHKAFDESHSATSCLRENPFVFPPFSPKKTPSKAVERRSRFSVPQHANLKKENSRLTKSF